MNQRKYTSGILTKFLDSHEQTWLDTAADDKFILTQDMALTDAAGKAIMSNLPYREVIGSLLWLSSGTS